MKKNKHKEKHYSNIFGYIAHVFTTNKPLSAIVLFSAIVVGFLSYWLTPKQYNPEVIRPAFLIATNYKGGSAQEVRDFVSQKIVHDMRQISGVDEVRSQSFSGAYSLVQVLFDVGENEEDAKTKIFTKILENTDLKKDGIGEPYIISINPDDVPIMTVNVSSETLDQNHIREKIFQKLDALETITGVSEVLVVGGEAPSLKIELDKGKMQSQGVSLPEVLSVLQKQNNKIYAPSVSTGYRKINLELDNYVYSAADVERIYIRPHVTLADIANIELSYQEKNSFVGFHNRGDDDYQNVFISFAKKKGTNTSTVSQSIRKEIEAIFSDTSLSVSVLRDDGIVADREIQGLMFNLLVSVLIVGLVLYLFLSARPAFIVMAAIPIILLLVFIPGYFAGQTINRITLFALILSLGLLVDSATVVVENIYRNIKKNQNDSVHKNTVRAVNQVGIGLVLSTVTSVVVFFPVKFITGMMGPYMGPIAFFVPVALTISLLTAFVITPFVADRVFSKGTIEQKAPLDAFFQKVSSWYEKKLSYILGNKKYMRKILLSLLFAFVLALLMPLLKIVHFQMLPKADKDQLYVHVDYPKGTDVLLNKKYTNHIIQYILEHTDVDSIQSFVAVAPIPDFNGLFKGVQNRKGGEQATLRVNLKKQRSHSSIRIARELRSLVHRVDTPYQTAIKILEDPPGPPVQATFMLELYSKAQDTQDFFDDVYPDITQIKGLVDIDNSREEAFEKNILRVNHDKLSSLGVSLDALYASIQAASSRYAFSQFHNNKKEYTHLEISFPRDQRSSFNDILDIKIPNQRGGLVPLSEIVEIQSTRNDFALYDVQGENYAYISGEVEDRSIVYVVLDAMKIIRNLSSKGYRVRQTSLSSFSLEKGDTKYEIKIDGEWDMTLNNFRDLGIAMIAALFLVYAILVAQYQSFKIPALIMVTIPLGLVGILFGFTLLDLGLNIYLTATALIGFIALIGIVVNNAILYLEYFVEIIEEHPDMDHKRALVEAGKVRLRPIMLTSLTTVLANLTIVSDPVWSGLAWAIIFGLSLSTVMTLVIFPVFYIYFDKS